MIYQLEYIQQIASNSMFAKWKAWKIETHGEDKT